MMKGNAAAMWTALMEDYRTRQLALCYTLAAAGIAL
jgi:hypothetical protein